MPTSESRTRRVSLLIVEDELSLLAMLREYFERQGFIVFAASAVEQALDVLSTGEVEVVLSDLCIGNLRDGGLCVAAAASSAGIPVMLITAFPDDRIRHDPRFGRISALLHKPASFRTIQSTLSSIMNLQPAPLCDTHQMLRDYAPWLLQHSTGNA